MIKCIKLDYKDENWIDEGKSQLIFQNDMAYELGGNLLDAVSGIAFSDNEELIPNDEVILYGKNFLNFQGDFFLEIILGKFEL